MTTRSSINVNPQFARLTRIDHPFPSLNDA
jgi:hypothetical protein